MDQASAKPDDTQDNPAQDMAEALQQFQSTFEQWMGQWQQPPGGVNSLTSAKLDPQKVIQAQWSLWQSQQQLWMQTTAKFLNSETEAEEIVTSAKGDRRFKDEAWTSNPLFSHLKQSYLINARWLEQMMDAVEGLDADTRQTLTFYNQQLIDAFAPTNFALSNPQVLRTTMETKGKNLIDGMSNLMRDVARSQGSLQISQTDLDAFEVGENIAITPGEVVYQNEFFQLLQYQPATAKTYARPLLIVPPWINKFYILDLKPENSFIKWAVEQGLTVFVMSWVNPDESFRDKTFDDYVTHGVVAAIDAVEQATGESEINTIGYCIGGTLLAITLAYLAARDDRRIKSATYFAAQVDFEDAGCLRIFTGPEQLAKLAPELDKTGYLDGWQMASAFNMLRSNDLIWYFVINNYLLGNAPKAFELLHWNADSTRFPARLLKDYLTNMYQRNALATPGAFEIDGVGIDLSNVAIPTFIQATKEDHISPPRSVYKSMGRFTGDRRYVLAGSGHIAGVINPPASGRYQYWTNDEVDADVSFDDWYAGATETAGSWWPLWKKWIVARSGKKIDARHPGDGELPPIEAAPGSYVKVRS